MAQVFRRRMTVSALAKEVKLAESWSSTSGGDSAIPTAFLFVKDQGYIDHLTHKVLADNGPLPMDVEITVMDVADRWHLVHGSHLVTALLELGRGDESIDVTVKSGTSYTDVLLATAALRTQLSGRRLASTTDKLRILKLLVEQCRGSLRSLPVEQCRGSKETWKGAKDVIEKMFVADADKNVKSWWLGKFGPARAMFFDTEGALWAAEKFIAYEEKVGRPVRNTARQRQAPTVPMQWFGER